MEKPTKISRKLCLAFMLMVSVFTASAADFMVDSICYNIIGESEVEVTKLNEGKYQGEVYIPATVVHDGITYQVTCIGKQAFYTCSDLTLVDIPEGITEIKTEAFYYCTNLEFVDLPNSLVKIGGFAFGGCSKFQSVYIPRNVAEIDGNVFSGCSGITGYVCSDMNAHYRVVDGVLYTKDMTQLVSFPAGSSITVFDIPGTVTKVHNTAFYYAENLTEINFPESVRWIGYSALRGCIGLTSVVFNDGIAHIGPACLSHCDNVSYVHLPASLDTLDNTVIGYLPSLEEITIPRNVKYIADFGAVNSQNLKHIYFEEGSCLQAIGLRAFEDCFSLEDFDMPNSVTSIEAQIFGNCSSLKSVHLSDNLTEMGSSIIWKCTSLRECVIPKGVALIRNSVLSYCSSLQRLRIGDKDAVNCSTTLSNSTMSNVSSLTRLELGANVDSLTYLSISGHNLKVVICWNPNPPRCNSSWSSFNLAPNTTNAVLYVPKASLEAYSTAYTWKDFTNIVAIEDVGDVNEDGVVNISDAIALISHLSADAPVNVPRADVNLDGSINISDVTTLINRLLLE